MTHNEMAGPASAGNGLVYLLAGGGIGAAIALLFAPKTGAKLRGDIAGWTFGDAAEDAPSTVNDDIVLELGSTAPRGERPQRRKVINGGRRSASIV